MAFLASALSTGGSRASRWKHHRPSRCSFGYGGVSVPHSRCRRRSLLRWALHAVASQLARAEAPAGAQPSEGAESFFADYELQFDPAHLGSDPLKWRLPAWHFQEEFVAFHAQREGCLQHCASPPLSTALFVLSLPEHVREQILKECPGMLIASIMLLAESRLNVDGRDAETMFSSAQQLREAIPAPGWGLDVAAHYFDSTRQRLEVSSPRPWPPRENGVSSICSAGAVDLVVAHCNEDLAWLVGYAGIARIWIYEKCQPASLPRPPDGAEFPCIAVERLPNLAMESLAYATHMHRRHGDLAVYTAFVQGNPHEHAPQRLVDDTLRSIAAGRFDVPFLHLNTRRFLSGTSYCIQDLFRRLFPDRALPEAFGSYCCSQFVVRSDRIMAQPADMYERIVAYLLGKLPLACAQDSGYDSRPRIAVSALFEHLWHVVLGEDPVLPVRRGDGRLPLFARVDVGVGELPEQFS